MKISRTIESGEHKYASTFSKDNWKNLSEESRTSLKSISLLINERMAQSYIDHPKK